MDFCNIIDLKLFQIYILGIINIEMRDLIDYFEMKEGLRGKMELWTAILGAF